MAFTPSVGDVMMLSQLAWKIGCAFTSGRAGAPAEFQEVENELKSLTTSITLLAESLDKDDSIITRSDDKTREGLDKILGFCRQTLENLDAFVNQYQEIRRHDGVGGVVTEKRWKHLLIKNYKKIMWTTEGGGIQSLRDMLAMHTESVSLTVQALQNQSLSRLENAIEPMAEKVSIMHRRLNGDLDIKIEEIHHMMLSTRANLDSYPRPPPSRLESVSSLPASAPVEAKESWQNPYQSLWTHPYIKPSGNIDDPLVPQKSSESVELHHHFQDPWTEQPTWMSDSLFPDRRGSTLIPVESLRQPPPRYSGLHRASHNPSSSIESPKVLTPTANDQSKHSSLELSSRRSSMLPPPATSLGFGVQPMTMNDHGHSSYLGIEGLWTSPSVDTYTAKEQAQFRKALLEHSMTLCEVRGTLVDFTQPDTDVPGDWKMNEATSACDILISTKRQTLSSGGLRFITSIWTLSDDCSVRMQQKLADGEEVVPYTVWGSNEKVVLRVPTELKFHGSTIDAKLVRTAKTAWVNYVFKDEIDANAFQNALMGKCLLLSVKTKRTMRIHNGIVTGTFAYAEQLCGLENLRIFRDCETGGIFAMIHYSPQFREGYLVFYLNSARDPIRIRDDGERSIRIKGIHVPLEAKKPLQRQPSAEQSKAPKSPKHQNEKEITGAKIEFYTEAEKQMFKDKFREVQGTFFPGD